VNVGDGAAVGVGVGAGEGVDVGVGDGVGLGAAHASQRHARSSSIPMAGEPASWIAADAGS
jgi:hypothetical protein